MKALRKKLKATDSPANSSKSEFPPAFLAAMRFNAIQRGMKWKDTYDLTADFHK